MKDRINHKKLHKINYIAVAIGLLPALLCPENLLAKDNVANRQTKLSLECFASCSLMIDFKDASVDVFDVDSKGAIDIKENIAGGTIDVLTYDSPEETREAYYYYQDLDIVDYLEIDGEIKTDSYSSWGWYSLGENQYSTNIDEFVEAKKDSFKNQVLVAVIDTGINPDHQIFEGHNFVQGKDFVNDDNDPMDDNGHGTHCAGIIAEATGDYVSFMAIKTMKANGRGSISMLYEGIEYAIKAGADIISISLSDDGSGKYDFSSVYSAIDSAKEKGIIVIAAAGNNSAIGKYTAPANSKSAISVGATNSSGDLYERSNWGEGVDIYAPGVDVKSADFSDASNYVSKTGTSQAGPHVAAVAAMLKAINITYNSDDILKILQESPGQNNFSQGVLSYVKDGETYTGTRLMVGKDTRVEPCYVEKKKTDISTCQISVDLSDEFYTGLPITKNICVMRDGIYLTEGKDYYVEYSNNIDGGCASLNLFGMGAYEGSFVAYYNIIQYSLPVSVRISSSTVKYTGKAIKPDVISVVDVQGRSVDPRFYQVSYSSNKSIGKGKCTVTMQGPYTGFSSASFKILPVNVANIKASSKSNSITIKWKVKSTNISGIQIKYGTDKKLKKSKTITIKSKKVKSKTIKKLKSKKNYYYKIRTYKTVTINGKKTKYYSSWSAIKKIKTKKKSKKS